ncbi:MAG: hypothetical protein LBI10_00710 [Deltaproteobacteria bacterium]|jgi:predicted FMN-binding regulatory protein PaiB|nr:hypothetical protein [Deltaproteobacteria bacterium]
MMNQYLAPDPEGWLKKTISGLKKQTPDDIDLKTTHSLLDSTILFLTQAIAVIVSLKTKLLNLTAKFKIAQSETRRLKVQNAQYLAANSKLKAQVCELKTKLAAPRPNSKNSHLPPGKDISAKLKP